MTKDKGERICHKGERVIKGDASMKKRILTAVFLCALMTMFLAIAAHADWQNVNGVWMYYDASGYPVYNQWVGGRRYYVDATGARVTGLNEIDGLKYYFDPGTGVLRKGKFQINGRVYLAHRTKGTLYENEFVRFNGKEYYATKNGEAAAFDWVRVNGSFYWFDGKGRRTNIKAVGAPSATADASLGQKIAAYARQFVGNPYVWGGTSLTNGADCSGFCYSVFGHFGIMLMRVADDQMHGPNAGLIASGYRRGYEVAQKDLLPGDLVFYGANGYARHVALYIGNNMVVEAAGSAYGIITGSMYRGGTPIRYMRYWG